MTLVETARKLAEERHAGQGRPNISREPKIIHVAEVAALVENHGGSAEEIAAAWLHDIIEDTQTTREEVVDVFGAEIAEIVDGMTDPDGYAALPLIERKKLQADRLVSKRKSVKLIKICDQYSNILSVLNDPPLDWTPEKSMIYIEGAKKLADICRPVSEEMYRIFIEVYNRGSQKYRSQS